jgi:hypothetical protein
MNNHRMTTRMKGPRPILELAAQPPAPILPMRTWGARMCPTTVVVAGLIVSALALGLVAWPWTAEAADHWLWSAPGLSATSGLAWTVIAFWRRPMRAAPLREHRLRMSRTRPTAHATAADRRPAPDPRRAEPRPSFSPQIWSSTMPAHFVRQRTDAAH